MKKALTVKLAMAFVVAMTASSWAQEVQQSPNVTSPTTVQGAVIAQPAPMVQAPMVQAPIASDCGCNQTFTAAPMQQYVQPACPSCSSCASCNSGCASCNSGCASCGTIGQVGYNEIIRTGSPVVTSAPTGSYGQTPMYSNGGGCCGQTYAPTYSNASVTTVAPGSWTGDSGCSSCNSCSSCGSYEPSYSSCNSCNSCNTCNSCQQQRRGLFGRYRR